MGLNVVVKSWPVVLSDQKFASFFNAKMAGQRIVVVTANQLRLNSFGYKQ